ncbi:hypothetical protein QTP70_004317 [Hemibagrus guttatus]|uniref:WASH complex subunit 3 n=1 Tax=Hemibagrus guttatus TaxID=175788 RepID=A0AAE0UZB6_9TELE|nr:hypothetical protein QTP70_004317 [Hemibagrus guttatus]KAK3557765.1 hypothetical protein QTP86_000282 [Hemibagrus guttatus]
MDEDGLPIVGSGIDLTKVPAIQQRRLVAFLNQFIVHTVRFLNRFSTVCDEVPGQRQEGSQGPKGEPAADNVMTVAKDPRYARYLKMVQVGVPVMAIKNKMILEGLDPSLLDSPDAPVPDSSKKGTEEQEDDSSDSESSFSD